MVKRKEVNRLGKLGQSVQTDGEKGLGIKDISRFNSFLLAKWKWGLVSEEQGKWKEVLVSKYDMNDRV